MVQVLSKLTPITISCEQYVHPWAKSCSKATTGLYLYAMLDSLRIYATVYCLALLMKGKIPKLEDIKKTIKGILRSTAFLSFNAFGFSGSNCILRNLMGYYNFLTVSGIPAFIASFLAILIERPSRRPLLALYVTNIATETVWKMMVARKMVRNIPHGEIAIFATSLAFLMTFFKAGFHKQTSAAHPDTMFSILKFIYGPHEEKDSMVRLSRANSFHRADDNDQEATRTNRAWSYPKKNSSTLYKLVMQALKLYKRFVYKIKCYYRHSACPHPFSCVYYTLQRSTKLFSIGLGFQLGLQLIFNIRTIIRSPKSITDILFKQKNLNMAMFLGGSSGLFTAIMCLLRRVTNQDSAVHAFPAGLIAGLAFYKYPDNTIALYVFWKLLQIAYNLGIDKGYLPNVPGFIVFLYSLSTAILFHAGLVEPLTLRSSYWKFLHSLSGGRIAIMDRKAMDVWGLDTSGALETVLKRTKTKPVMRYIFVQ